MVSLIKKILKMSSLKERKTVLENTLSLSLMQGLNYLLPIVILPYLIRVIGADKFGLIAFAQAFVQYFMILTDYGSSVWATREISLYSGQKEKVSAIFSSVIIIKVILTALSFLIFFLVIESVPKFKSDQLVYIFSFLSVIGNALFPVWFFMGTEKMKYITTLNIIGGIVYILGIFIFVKTPADYLWIPLLNSFVFLINAVLGLSIVFKKFGVGFKAQPYKEIRSQLKTGWHIFSSIVAINAYTVTRTFAVGLLTNNTLTAYYFIAERAANIVRSFPLDSFSQAVYPRLTRIFRSDTKRAYLLMQKIQRVAMHGFLISLPVIFLFTPGIVKIICGQEFKEVTLALRLLLISVFFVGANAYRVQFLLVCGKANIYSKLHIAAALAGLPLIFFFIKSFSYLGAAYSTIIIETGVLFSTVQIIRNLPKNQLGR